LALEDDIERYRASEPWLLQEYFSGLGFTSSAGETVMHHFATWAPQVKTFTAEEKRFFAFTQKMKMVDFSAGELWEKKWQRGQDAIDRGAKINAFGKALAKSPLRYIAIATALIADHSKKPT
jgi:hypothetical protein